ncbi:MAG: HD-GYP domain-containing protein [Peptostreptococcales bacterium]
MRFVPSACLYPGMKIGKSLYGNDGILMLREGQVLTNVNIDRINKLQLLGVYIDDDISNNIEIESIIDNQLRYKAIASVKEIFALTEKGNSGDVKGQGHSIRDRIIEAKKMIGDIVDEIMINKDLLINMIDLKVFDDYTYYHCVNVAVLSIVIGVGLKLDRSEICKLGLGALLHDIGKIFVDKEILNKPSKLEKNEIQEVQEHPEKGYKYLRQEWEIPLSAYLAVLDHHECYDGSGYPKGKKAENIHLFGRIICIADVYDALISDRPYRKAMLPSDAIEYIMYKTGSMFDPEIVDVFLDKVVPYPLGTCVRLSNGLKGIVVENYQGAGFRPKLRIIDNQGKEGLNDPKDIEYWDLEKDYKTFNTTIIEILKE